jgi:hypothetical protein
MISVGTRQFDLPQARLVTSTANSRLSPSLCRAGRPGHLLCFSLHRSGLARESASLRRRYTSGTQSTSTAPPVQPQTTTDSHRQQMGVSVIASEASFGLTRKPKLR